jgi:hypothetical protein
MDIATLRAWWAHRQGLDGSLAGATPAEVLERTGWARSVGGSAPYLGLFARAGLDRVTVDEAVSSLDIHELPSARGCTYVLPAADFALGLAVGAGAPRGEIAMAVRHLGVTTDEIDKLALAVVDAIDAAGRPLDPAAIKTAVGDAARGLGDAGRRRGTAGTLPLALGLLQSEGRIRRVPADGRLDRQRFSYTTWAVPDGAPGDAATELARRYFAWAAPASLKHFRWFSGLTAVAAKAAVAPLGLVAVEGTDLLIPHEPADELAGFEPPAEPSYALVAGIDGIHLLHRELGRLLDPDDATRPVPGGPAGATLGAESDPPCHLVMDRGRIVGLWEFDPGAGEIVASLFVPPDDALRGEIERTEAFARDQLGDVRSFSLDTPKSRAPRLEALRSK